MVLVIVQPEDHGRVPGDSQQKVPVVAEAMIAEQLRLHGQVVVVVHLGVAGREDVMPEQRHLLFQRATCVDHVVQPLGRPRKWSWPSRLGGRDIPEQEMVIGSRNAIRRIDQLFDGCLVTLRGAPFNLVTGRSESGASHEVRHQDYFLLVRHRLPPCAHWV